MIKCVSLPFSLSQPTRTVIDTCLSVVVLVSSLDATCDGEVRALLVFHSMDIVD